MMLPPLMERELQAALRKKTVRVRLWTAVIGVLTTLLHLSFRGSSTGGGQSLFQVLLVFSCATALFSTIQFSIDLIAVERRNHTLGLLVLTGLSSSEIFLSKLTGALVVQLFNAFALLPCFGVSFVLGGVPASAFLATAVLVPNLVILALAISMVASTVSRDEDGALLVAAAVGCFVGVAGPGIYYLFTWMSPAPLSAGWLLLSPAYGFTLIWELFKTGTPAQFWINSAITICWSVTLATFAAWFLHHTWREGVGSVRLLPSLPAAGRKLAQRWAASVQPDKKWFDPNPFVWLALRDKRSVRFAWAAVLLVAAIWFLGVALWPRTWGTLLSAILAALSMYSVVGLMAMFSAAKRIGEDRRRGTLELLLTTPLSVEKIIQGQRQALWIGFQPLLRCLFTLNAALALIVIAVRDWDVLALAVWLESWGAIACMVILSLRSQTVSQVMWAALNTGRPVLAIRKAVCPPGVLVGFAFFIHSIAQTGWPRSFPQGSLGEFWVVTLIFVGTALAAVVSGRWDPSTTRLTKNFRWVVQQPLPEPSDPRSRRWDITKPFPQRSTPSIFGRM